MSKTLSQLKQDFYDKYKLYLPNISIEEGSTEYDTLVSAPADVMIQPYTDLDYLFTLFLITETPEDVLTDDMTQWAADFGVTRLAATKAIVTLTFYRDDPPDRDITISVGKRVSTIGVDPVEFEVTEEKIMYSSNPSIYYDAATGKYAITVAAQAIVAGVASRVGSNLIKVINTTITGITSVNNVVAATGGSDLETNTALATRVKASFRGRNASVWDGLEALILAQQPIDSLVVDATNPLMQRDAGRGRCVDTYVVGSLNTSYTDSTTMTSTGEIQFTKQPVSSITSVVGNVTYDSSVYSLVKDTGFVKKSSRANDKIRFTSTGTIPTQGESLTIKFVYNKLLSDLMDLLDAKENKVPNRDNLVYEATRVDITFKANIVLDADVTDPAAVKSNVETAVSNYVQTLLKFKVERSDLTTTMGNVTGVDDSKITELSGIDEDGNTVTPDAWGDLVLSEREYPVLVILEVTIV